MTDPQCHDVAELIPEIAMGVAPGPERAAALAHIVGCSSCRSDLEQTAKTVDELLLLAPEVEPPSGFETRVLSSFGETRKRASRRPLVLAAAAVGLVIALLAGVAGLGLATWVGAGDRQLADQYQRTLDVADGKAFRGANLTLTTGPAAGTDAGQVFTYDGNPSWVFMTVNGVPSDRYRVQLVSTTGEVWDIGVCRVRDGYESWGAAVDVPLATVDRLEMRSATGATFSAQLT